MPAVACTGIGGGGAMNGSEADDGGTTADCAIVETATLSSVALASGNSTWNMCLPM